MNDRDELAKAFATMSDKDVDDWCDRLGGGTMQRAQVSEKLKALIERSAVLAEDFEREMYNATAEFPAGERRLAYEAAVSAFVTTWTAFVMKREVEPVAKTIIARLDQKVV